MGKTKVPSHHDLSMSNFRGTLGLNNAFLTVGWPCIMYYAISPGFPYVFYDSKSQPNALSEICIITVCTMRISTVLEHPFPATCVPSVARLMQHGISILFGDWMTWRYWKYWKFCASHFPDSVQSARCWFLCQALNILPDDLPDVDFFARPSTFYQSFFLRRNHISFRGKRI